MIAPVDRNEFNSARRDTRNAKNRLRTAPNSQLFLTARLKSAPGVNRMPRFVAIMTMLSCPASSLSQLRSFSNLASGLLEKTKPGGKETKSLPPTRDVLSERVASHKSLSEVRFFSLLRTVSTAFRSAGLSSGCASKRLTQQKQKCQHKCDVFSHAASVGRTFNVSCRFSSVRTET